MSERYRVEQTGKGFWPYCVRAGNGTRDLYVGHKKTCDRVAAELTTAFRDGEFVGKGLYDALAAEAQALREEVAKLTQYNKSLNEENTRLLVDCEETDKEVVVLRTKLAMAEDAAAKGDAARQQCGGMEMEIEELRAELAELRARVVVPDGFALVPIEPNDEMLSAGCVADNAMHSNLSNRDNKHRCYQSMLNAAPRLNGLTVSEGLLRKWLELMEHGDYREGHCMCGSPVDSHGIGDGHAPIDAGEYYAGQVMEELRALLNQDKENGNG
ncbi:hypothetical protein LZM19_00925 [Pseudomonas aeruginosa]|nr:hypothetical protein [Pseudomonas aeruginosa]